MVLIIDARVGEEKKLANYATVAAMIAANDVVITAAYALAISTALTATTNALETQIGAVSTAVDASTKREW